ncbi:MAG TPA: FG-GAP-like repeat-containing protein [Chthonomonadales bacterium]|nr:FG-GAP-like repeat-containing protein [Chthonomonadales bacterium]
MGVLGRTALALAAVALAVVHVTDLAGGRERPPAQIARAAPVSPIKPRVIPMDFPMGEGGRGGILAADVDGDRRMELVVTAPGNIAAYRLDGRRVWHIQADVRVSAGASESAGLPGHHAPGVQVADVDGDGRAELLFLDQESRVHIRDARTGAPERVVRVPHPEGAERWEHLAVGNLRGRGDRDLVLQATNARGYRMGRFVSAYAIEKLDGPPLWSTRDFGALAHGPFRLADLDGDGRDEVCGYTILGPDGRPTAWQYPPVERGRAGGASFHIDSLFVADVRPDVPGLEVVLLEEGRNHVACVNKQRGVLWWTAREGEEPQNAAVGEFDLSRPGLEVWCRSRRNLHQQPWVKDAQGQVIARYAMDDVAPEGWTASGVEVIFTIDWTGGPVQLALAKERHTEGDVALFEPMTGRFVAVFREKAYRIYAADVTGDWREEVIVVNREHIHVYQNPAANPRPNRPRLWTRNHYRRAKMSWNYYSP